MTDKILITGCAGLVGSTAVRYFSQYYSVVGIDNNGRLHLSGKDTDPVRKSIQNTPNFTYRYADVRILDPIQQIFDTEQPKFVLHCASQSDHNIAKTKTYADITTNVLGTANVLQASKQAIFLYLSQIEPTPSQQAAELIVKQYNAAIFRCGNIVGTNEQNCGLLNEMCWSAKNEGKVKYCSQITDLLYAWDLMIAIHFYFQNPKEKEYEIGGNDCHTDKIVQKIKEYREISIVNDGKCYPCSNSTKFHNDYSWTITRDINSMIEELMR